MKQLRIGMIILTIMTALAWFGFILTNQVSILTALVGNFLQVVIFLKMLKYKKETKNSCTTCGFNDGVFCNVGEYYAEKGMNIFCYKGELWKKKCK